MTATLTVEPRPATTIVGRLDVGWDAHGRILTLDDALALSGAL